MKGNIFWLLVTGLAVVAMIVSGCAPATPAPTEVPPEATEVPPEATPEAPPEVPSKYSEAPMLAELVAAGELPPVDERVPEEPLVIEPYDRIGTYGGTWHRYDTSSQHVAISMYAHSIVHWVKDGLDMRGGLAKSWESNADKTEWTFYFREGTRWSNGDPFTVDDIIFWWEDMVLCEGHADTAPDWAIAAGEHMELEKIDDYTLKFKYAGPAPLLPDRLAMWANSVNVERVVAPSKYLKQFHPDYSDYTDFELMEEMQDWRINPDCPVLNAWMPVEYEPAARLVMERNPYYYAVDTAGNQLPYFDRVDVTYVENLEVAMLKVINGEADISMRPCKYAPLSDLATIRANEVEYGYTAHLWDGGSGTGSIFFPNHNHPDPGKQELYHTHEFLIALSYAINRPEIQTMIYFGTGELTTGTFSPKAVEYHRSEEGRKIYKEWRDLAVEYDPEKAKSLLDGIGVVDQDGDGWRDMPGGKELELRIDLDAETSRERSLCSELVAEDWKAVSLKTILNPIPGEAVTETKKNATFDIMDSWELGDGPNHLVYPQWMVPIGNERWAPLYGAWYSVIGTAKEGTELDKDSRDRSPPREEPPAGSPVARLQELYDKAKVEPDDQKRDELVFEMIRIHMNDGPFFIGTVANTPTIQVFKNNVGNVPTKEQLGMGGFTNPWIMVYFGAIYPEQFFFKD